MTNSIWFQWLKSTPQDQRRKERFRQEQIKKYRDEYYDNYLQQVVIEKVKVGFSEDGDPDIRKHLLDILSECKRRKADAFISQSLFEDDEWFNYKWDKYNA